MSDKIREALEWLADEMRSELTDDGASLPQWLIKSWLLRCTKALADQPAQVDAEEPLEYLLNVCRTSPSLSNQEIIDQMRNVFDSSPELTVFMETCGDCDPCIGGRPDQCAVGGYPVLNTPPAPAEQPAQKSTTKLWTHAQWQARLCKHCGYDHSAGPLCHALNVEQTARGETDRSPEDEAERFIQAAIDRAPEPLRRLGEYLTSVLDEDQWKTAEPMLLGAAVQPAQGEAVADAERRAILWERLHDKRVEELRERDAEIAKLTAPPAPSVPDDTARLNWLEAREASLIAHREAIDEGEFAIWWTVAGEVQKVRADSISGHPLGSVRAAIDAAMLAAAPEVPR